MGIAPPTGDTLFTATLAADLVSNAAYYSLIGCAKKKHLPALGAVAGIAAGVGALTLTKPLGLSDAPVTRTNKNSVTYHNLVRLRRTDGWLPDEVAAQIEKAASDNLGPSRF